MVCLSTFLTILWWCNPAGGYHFLSVAQCWALPLCLLQMTGQTLALVSSNRCNPIGIVTLVEAWGNRCVKIRELLTWSCWGTCADKPPTPSSPFLCLSSCFRPMVCPGTVTSAGLRLWRPPASFYDGGCVNHSCLFGSHSYSSPKGSLWVSHMSWRDRLLKKIRTTDTQTHSLQWLLVYDRSQTP